MPKVSIIVPCYNTAPYLDECMQSIVNQTLSDTEIICIDDGSTDETGSMLDDYAAKDSRIKVIHKENGGYGKAMNVGIDNATGEYIGIVEPDDYVALDMYEILYNKAKETNVDFVKSLFFVFEENTGNRVITLRKAPNTLKYLFNKKLSIKDNLDCFRIPMNTWTGIYKKDFIEKYHIRHNETPGASFQDNGFWFQTFMFSDSAYFIDKAFYLKRKDNPNSSCRNKEKVFAMKKEYDFINNIIDNHSELKKYFKKIYYVMKFRNYCFTFNRIDISFKKLFLKTFTKEFKEAYKNKEIDEKLFSEKELETLHTIVKNPMKFYRKSLNRLSLMEKIFSIKNSKSGFHKELRLCGIKIKFKRSKNYKNEISLLQKQMKKLKYQLYQYCAEDKRSELLKQWYFEKTGEKLNLENPQTFNEKIQWLKLYDSTPIKTRLADKYLVRDWVKEKIGEEYLIPLLGVWDSFDEIDFDKLPNQFVLKCNHGSGYNIIVTDKSKLNIEATRNKINTWMNEDFAFKFGFEMHYSEVPRKIIAEKYIENNGNDLYDYKLWCFDGEVKYIQYIAERNEFYKMAFFDREWNKQNFITNHRIIDYEIKKPDNLSKIITLAETLSKDFNFVRVDFYILDDGSVKFGEMTFTPTSGTALWQPKEQDFEFGKMLKLPIDNKEFIMK